MMESVRAARHLALANGVAFTVSTGIDCDPTDSDLCALVPILQERLLTIGVKLEAVLRDGDLLTATVREDEADEPLCPAAFQRVVRAESYRLTGEAWSGRFVVAAAAPSPGPRVTALVA